MITIAGVSAGMGSMLIPGKQMGLKVLGNVEHRKIFFQIGKTFENYFDAPISKDYSKLDHLKGATIVFCQDSCGDFSKFKLMGESGSRVKIRSSQMLTTVNAVKEINPEFVVFDTLPGALATYGVDFWRKNFANEYNLFFEYISNYGYGNPQHQRNRLFIIAAKKKWNFQFIPGEQKPNIDLDALFDIPEGVANHYPLNFEDTIRMAQLSKICDPVSGEWLTTWGDVNEVYARKYKHFYYKMANGKIRNRPGARVPVNQKPGTTRSMVGSKFLIFPSSGPVLPLTLRQRLRLAGIPDDFVIDVAPTKAANWKPLCAKITSKSIPTQAVRYVTQLIVDTVLNNKKEHFKASRIIAPHELISNVQSDYCRLESAASEHRCKYCSVKKCPLRIG